MIADPARHWTGFAGVHSNAHNNSPGVTFDQFSAGTYEPRSDKRGRCDCRMMERRVPILNRRGRAPGR